MEEEDINSFLFILFWDEIVASVSIWYSVEFDFFLGLKFIVFLFLKFELIIFYGIFNKIVVMKILLCKLKF